MTTRVPRGVPAGGQFTTGSHTEPDTTLFETADELEGLTLHAVGFNDEITTCSRCGKQELAGTVVLADLDGIERARMGTTCASRALGRPISRAQARSKEVARRSGAVRDLRDARDAAANGEFARAQMLLRFARQHGLHRRDELDLATRVHHQVEMGLAARSDRWAVVAKPGVAPSECDTLEQARDAADRYSHLGGYLARWQDGAWVPAA